MHPIIINALLSGVMIALISAPLGCFLIWKKISSFSDAVSHIALPGIALGIVFNISSFVCSVITVFFTAVFISQIRTYGKNSANALLVALAEIGLGLGYLILSLSHKGSEFNTLLFGDILSITVKDLYYIGIITLVSLITLFFIKDKLLLSILCEDIAVTEGINTKRQNIIFMLILALVVSASIKTVGILLVSSLLIIPAVTARMLASNYLPMLFFAAIIGIFNVITGVFISFKIDVPPVSAITSSLGFSLFIIFFIQFFIKYFKK